MKRIVIEPQKSDMGEGFGNYEFDEGKNLGDFLNWSERHARTWGTITIFNQNNKILRKFDFDLYNKQIFYHYLSRWEYELKLKKIEFNYCFMSEDVEIYLK